MKAAIVNLFSGVLTSFDTTLNNATAVLGGQGGSGGSGGAISNAFSVSGANFDAAWRWVINNVTQGVLAPACMVIIAICFMIDLANTAMKLDMLRWEHVLRTGIKLVFAQLCISWAPTFMKAIYEQCAAWIGNLGNTASLGSEASTILDQVLSNAGLLQFLVALATSAVVFIALKACGIIIVVIAFARMFEILVYVAVSPIPCAFFPLGEGQGMGVSRITINFFKSYIAVCLQGLLMILCLRVFGIVMNGMMSGMIAEETAAIDDLNNVSAAQGVTTVFNLGWVMLLGSITLVIIMMRCGSWAKSIMDTH